MSEQICKTCKHREHLSDNMLSDYSAYPCSCCKHDDSRLTVDMHEEDIEVYFLEKEYNLDEVEASKYSYCSGWNEGLQQGYRIALRLINERDKK